MSLLNRWSFEKTLVATLKTMMTMRSHVVTLTAGSWESPVNRDPIAVDMWRSWVWILLAFSLQ